MSKLMESIKTKLNDFFAKKDIRSIGSLILFVVIIGAVAIFITRQTEEPKEEIVTIKPADCPPLAQGEQLYNIFTDKVNDPQIKQVIFNPLNVQKGEEQTVTVKVVNPNADTVTDANKVSVTYYTDNSLAAVALTMKRVDNVLGSVDINPDGPDLLTTFKGTWVKEDTTCITYTATVTAANAHGESTVDVTFR